MDSHRPPRGELAGAFGYPGVAGAYQYRPPYPPEVFDVLEGLITGRPRTVLDVGAGEGALARPLARRVDRVDALDISPAMIEAGRRRPGGRQPSLRWITGAVQSAALDGPYALVTAGASLHWMPAEQTLGRLARVMTASAFLVIVEHVHHAVPWHAELARVLARHSRDPGYDPRFSLTGALTAAGLMEITGHIVTVPVLFRQPVASYIEYFHSTATLAREWMPAQESAAFDRAIAQIVQPYATDGTLEMSVVADVTWGRPPQGLSARPPGGMSRLS